MSDLLDFSPPGQVTFSMAGARARFFNAGTTTPRAVFFDQAGTIAVPVPLNADAQGRFPQVFVAGGPVKVVVTQADDSTGYTLDPCVKVAASGAAAGSVTFSPSTQLPFNNVQAAIDGLASQVAGQGTNQIDNNRVINGAMQIWQRGTSFTLGPNATALTADRWRAGVNGGSFVISRQDVPIGTKFGQNNPEFALRMSISGQTDAVNHAASIRQQIEDVRTYAGETITVLGWARRASGAGDMAIDVFQDFGTGGSPSPNEFGIGQRVVLSTSWQPFAATFNVPSVTGKTRGTNNNDHLAVRFHASAGSLGNAQTGSLGLQTIGIDLWGIHIRRGTFAASETNTYVAPEFTAELTRAQRYYEKSYDLAVVPGTAAVNAGGVYTQRAQNNALETIDRRFMVTKRITPNMTIFARATGASGNVTNDGNGANVAVSLTQAGQNGFLAQYTAATGTPYSFHFVADAEI